MGTSSMRRILLAGVAALLAAVATAEEGPRMEIEPAEHDFGRVRQNQKLEHEFVLRNVGSEELVIERISTSCGCTAAVTSTRRLAPGAETTLRVVLETRRYKGAIRRHVSIASNDKRKVRTIQVRAYVEESGG